MFLDFHSNIKLVKLDLLEVIINNIWIVFLLFTLVYPRLQQQAIHRSRRRELVSLGTKRGSNVITLIHRQETLSLFGLPISRYIDIDDSEAVLRAIRLTPPNTPIDIIIHTNYMRLVSLIRCINI